MSDYAVRVGGERSCASLNPLRISNCQFRSKCWANWGILVALGSTSCGDGESTGYPVSLEARGEIVSVDSGSTTIGFVHSTNGTTEITRPFKISKFPITKKQFETCQESRICSAPKLDECSDRELARTAQSGPADTVAICVGRENAQAYCKWAGGRLPTLGEWLRAARGPSIQAYPWGNKRASCAQHPKSVEGRSPVGWNVDEVTSLQGCEVTSRAELQTRKHAAGAANSGMQDVLLSPAELIQGSEHSPYTSCTLGDHCLVYGVNPGSIDAVKPYTIGDVNGDAPARGHVLNLVPEAYGFRCVFVK